MGKSNRKAGAKRAPSREARNERRASALAGLLARIPRNAAYAVASLLVLLVAGFVARGILRNATTVIGYYGADDGLVETLEALVAREPSAKIALKKLDDADALSARLYRKVDVLVAGNGALTADLAPKAKPLSAAIAARYPSSITGSPFFSAQAAGASAPAAFRVMPIALDHFEAAYFRVLRKKSGAEIPLTVAELESYAAARKDAVQYPLICAGADDDSLFGLISAMIEAYGGRAGYAGFVDGLRKAEGIEAALALPVGGDAPAGTTFASVLDRVKRWQREELLLPEWYSTTEGTVTVTMEDNHAAVVLMSLRERRQKPFPMIRYFEGSRFPAETAASRAVVAPSICAMLFRETDAALRVMDRLSSDEWQEALSVATKLAPATLRSPAVDVQADDARFFAASAPGGPVPDVGSAAFRDPARRAAFAGDIRAYLARN